MLTQAGMIGFSDEQAQLLDIAENFCKDKSPVTRVRALLEDEAGSRRAPLHVVPGRRGQAELVEHRRTELERHLPDHLEELLGDRGSDARQLGVIAVTIQPVEDDLERGEALTELVVELPG